MTPTPTPPEQPPVSPTGQPMLPAFLAPYFVAVAAVAGVVAGASKIPGLGLPDAVFGWATLIATMFSALAALTPGWRKPTAMVLLMLSIGFSSCAHATTPPVSPLQISGATLDAAGVLFESTDTAIRVANSSLTPAQRIAWNEFLPRWNAGYHVAADAWRAAREKSDQTELQQASAALGALLGELGVFAAMVQSKGGG